METRETHIREFHLFAGIGGGIYGGKLLQHECCAGVEIDDYCTQVLKQRQQDGWMDNFPLYGDLTKLHGQEFKGTFDILCGGFPCQAFSHAAHGKNISEKNLWPEMFRFVKESDAPIVFGENVTLKALQKAKEDLESVGYCVELCKLSCGEIGADHRRDRYWLLAIKDNLIFQKVVLHLHSLPKLTSNNWHIPFNSIQPADVSNRREQLKAVGNAQSPYVVATVFRILVQRQETHHYSSVVLTEKEIDSVFEILPTWMKETYGEDFGYVHTPTTMANYSAPSMMKHQGCRNFKVVFDRPSPTNAEYLMAFPIGASSLKPQPKENLKRWYDTYKHD